MERKVYYIVVLIFLIFGCSESNFYNRSINLTETEEIVKFPLNNQTSNITDGAVLYNFEIPLLFNLNWKTNSIQIFDFEKQDFIKEMFFDREGPEGINDLFGIYVHNLDSIFLFSQLHKSISLTDTSGRVYSKLEYESPEGYGPAFVHNAYFTSTPLLIGDNLIVKSHFNGNIRTVTNEELNTKKLVYAINLKSGDSKLLGFKFPFDYLANGQKHFEPSISFTKDKFVFSFFGDHNIYYSNGLEDSLNVISGKSYFLQDNLDNIPDFGDRRSNRLYLFASGHYESLVYDEFRGLYYRFVIHNNIPDENIEEDQLRYFSGPFSIQIFNKDLEFINEKFFPGNKYHLFDYLISSKGLYLSLNHPLNPDIEEDFLKYQLFEIIN